MQDNTANEPIIIFGSSRSHGNTRKIIEEITRGGFFPFIDLSDFVIKPFDYEYRNKDDDFIPLMEKIVHYDTMIIATPVYWYQMSTQHKIFFDRFSDLLELRKDLGGKLRGKNLFVISSFQSSYPRGFEETWQQICGYLGMKYLGTSFVYSGTEDIQLVKNNAMHIEKARGILQI